MYENCTHLILQVASTPAPTAPYTAPLIYPHGLFASAPRELWLSWGPVEVTLLPVLWDAIALAHELGMKTTEHGTNGEINLEKYENSF